MSVGLRRAWGALRLCADAGADGGGAVAECPTHAVAVGEGEDQRVLVCGV